MSAVLQTVGVSSVPRVRVQGGRVALRTVYSTHMRPVAHSSAAAAIECCTHLETEPHLSNGGQLIVRPALGARAAQQCQELKQQTHAR